MQKTSPFEYEKAFVESQFQLHPFIASLVKGESLELSTCLLSVKYKRQSRLAVRRACHIWQFSTKDELHFPAPPVLVAIVQHQHGSNRAAASSDRLSSKPAFPHTRIKPVSIFLENRSEGARKQ